MLSIRGRFSVTLLPIDKMDTMRQSLKSAFGYDEFRPLQREIMESSLAGQDVFALLPTGGGKSLCFQLPAILREGLTLVVSPLIALMKDRSVSSRQRAYRPPF